MAQNSHQDFFPLLIRAPGLSTCGQQRPRRSNGGRARRGQVEGGPKRTGKLWRLRNVNLHRPGAGFNGQKFRLEFWLEN